MWHEYILKIRQSLSHVARLSSRSETEARDALTSFPQDEVTRPKTANARMVAGHPDKPDVPNKTSSLPSNPTQLTIITYYHSAINSCCQSALKTTS